MFSSKFIHEVTKEVVGPTSYPTGGFVVTIGELKKIKSASVKYIGNGEYLAQIITPDIDDTLKPNQVKIFVRDNIEATINEGGTATVTIGAEVGAVDLSSEKFRIDAVGY